jgi:hypothetical protein
LTDPVSVARHIGPICEKRPVVFQTITCEREKRGAIKLGGPGDYDRYWDEVDGMAADRSEAALAEFILEIKANVPGRAAS